ncbi:MAG: N-acetylmuramoyl-L-alanine amidase family protein [Acidimicrobiia bacterium]
MKTRVIVVISLLVGSFVGLMAWRWANASADPGPPAAEANFDQPATTPPPPSTRPPSSTRTTEAPIPQRVGYVVSRAGTALAAAPGETSTPIAGGVLFPVLAETGGGYRIFDTCNAEGWVAADDVEPGMVPERPGEGFDDSVFVIDPGHGLPDYGAIGPSGLAETEVNLDVSTRLVELLRSSRDIDWETGAVTPGDSVPAAATAVLTRRAAGPNGGDYQLGLTFRTTVANVLKATALVSIHHNSVPETTLDHPGSEAFVQADNPESSRLGGLIVEELRKGFSNFDADWKGSPGRGLISRVDPDGTDYYSLLDRSEVTAVIVEGAYISNPTEEALAMTDAFRQAYAEGVYRGLVRFVTTDEDPIPAPEPVLWDVDRPPPSLTACEVPAP